MSDSSLLPLHCNWADVPVERPQEGVERQIVTGRNAMICRLRFAPHTVTTPHDHPHEQLTLVMAGRVRFTLGNEERIAAPGDVIHIPSGCWHGATMLDEEVVLIDIFSPIREDFLQK